MIERKENTWKDSLKEKEKKLFKEKFFRYFDDNEKEETKIKKNGSEEWYIWLIRRVKLGIEWYFIAINLIERNWREKLHVVYQNFISRTVRQLF